MLAKSLSFLARADRRRNHLQGARVPIILTSRAGFIVDRVWRRAPSRS